MKGMVYANFDVAMIRDPKVLAAGPMARMLYVQIVLYCRENLTDGHLDELLVRTVAVDILKPWSLLDKLCAVGLLELTTNGWRIPEEVWRNWNPTRGEVEAKRQTESLRKQAYRDNVRNVSGGTGSPQNISRGQEEEEAKEEAKSSSSRVTYKQSDPFPTATTVEQRVADAIDWHARTVSATATRPVAYAATVRANTLMEYGGVLTAAAESFPHLSASDLVERVILHPPYELLAVREAWYADPQCEGCAGDGIVNCAAEGAVAVYAPCPCRQVDPYPDVLATVHQIGVAG